MFSQLIINALIAASIYALVAAGLGLIYSTSRFFHFAHGIVFTCGAYTMFVLNRWIGLPLIVAAVLAVPLGGLIGIGMEIVVFRPLIRRSATPLVLLLASLGIYVVLQNVVSLVFGDASQSVRAASVHEGAAVLGARLTPAQLVGILASLSLLLVLMFLLARTRWGRAIRAVMSEPDLASVSGVNVGGVVLWVAAIGSSLAAAAGMLQALDVDMTPTMGMNPLMMGVITAIIGGFRKVPGLILGAMVLGLSQQCGAWFIGSQWQDSLAFFVLLAFLVVRSYRAGGRRVATA